MGRAQGIVRGFNSGVGNTGTLARTAFKQAGDAAALMSGNLMKLGSVAAAVGGAGGPLAIMAAAAAAIAFKLASISDAQRVAAGGEMGTWAGEWDRASKAATDIAVVLGRPIADVLAKETGDIASILEFIAREIMPDYIREEQKLIALKEKQKAIDKEAAKAAEEAAKKAAEDARLLGEFLEKKGRDMQSRADAIAQSVRTPREELVGALAELSQLFEAGFVSAENYKRAAVEAGEKFREATELKDKASKQAKEMQGVGAATSATIAGFSALHKAARFQQTQAELQKEQLREQVKANQILEDLRKDLSKQEADIIINEVSF